MNNIKFSLDNINHHSKLLRIKTYCERLCTKDKYKKEEVEELYYSLLIKIGTEKVLVSDIKSFSEELLAL